jgi:hypothetical protein
VHSYSNLFLGFTLNLCIKIILPAFYIFGGVFLVLVFEGKFFSYVQQFIFSTRSAANWPKVRPHNSKEAGKKVGGRKK